MKAYELANDLNIAAAGSQTEVKTVDIGDRAFGPGASVVAVINCTGDPGTSVVVESREDSSSSFSALLTATAKGVKAATVVLGQEIRVTVNGTGTAGDAADVYLLAN